MFWWDEPWETRNRQSTEPVGEPPILLYGKTRQSRVSDHLHSRREHGPVCGRKNDGRESGSHDGKNTDQCPVLNVTGERGADRRATAPTAEAPEMCREAAEPAQK